MPIVLILLWKWDCAIFLCKWKGNENREKTVATKREIVRWNCEMKFYDVQLVIEKIFLVSWFSKAANDQTRRCKLFNVSHVMYAKYYVRINARGQETMLTRQVVITPSKDYTHCRLASGPHSVVTLIHYVFFRSNAVTHVSGDCLQNSHYVL